MADYNELYPQLPQQDVDKNFRINQISRQLQEHEKELENREIIYKKYNRARKLFLNTSTGTGTLSLLLGASGLGTGLTGVGLPIAVSLGAIGGVCAIMSVISGTFAKLVSVKVSKHEQTLAICRAKLNTIKDVISKALEDGTISHEEFLLVKNEIEKYNRMKRSVRRKFVKERDYKSAPQVDLKKLEQIRRDKN